MVEKQVEQDMTDSVYSLVDFPIVQEVEDRHCCHERDQRKGPPCLNVERGSTAKLGKALIPSAWAPSYRMDSGVGKSVVDLVVPFDLDTIVMEVDVRPCIDLGDQANLGCKDPRGSLCRV